jgi:hypothetical protein
LIIPLRRFMGVKSFYFFPYRTVPWGLQPQALKS